MYARCSRVGVPLAPVVTAWNALAVRTIFTENLTPIPSSGLYFGFTSIAVYDAVVAIEGGYESYIYRDRPPARASAQVAAAAAAQRVGEASAEAIIAVRANDGRNAAVTLDVITAPGVWRPTPPAFAPMLVPWLAFVRPLALRSPDQIRSGGPRSLTSAAYARDWLETRNVGAKTGSSRTPAQTETALFWNANSIAQYQAALADHLNRHPVSIVQSARAFALLSVGTADSLITCWGTKYHYASWRPVTAIQLANTDGNPATTADPTWEPLAATPPFPEYASGHACITGAATNVFGYLFGQRSIDMNIGSSVTGTVRHFESVRTLDTETQNARIWLGLHFRPAMTDGNRIGHAASAWAISREFRPTCRGGHR